MTEYPQGRVTPACAVTIWEDAAFQRRLARRRASERRFGRLGLGATVLGVGIVLVLLASIVGKGYSGFLQTYVAIDVHLDAARIDPRGTADAAVIAHGDFGAIVRRALAETFPDVQGQPHLDKLHALLSSGAALELATMVGEAPELIGQRLRVWVPADDDIDMLIKGHLRRDAPTADRRVDDQTLGWVDRLLAEGRLERRFNTLFFRNGDSRDPELAGIGAALMGSFYTLAITLALSLPLGVATAIYLEEFAPRNRLSDIVEVNINNLAAVPSIVFGLLGLAVFVNYLELPRSLPLVGGLVLTLMTLPTIIIASRVALRSVPPSIREAALGVGASRMQMVMQHVLPLALPGMLTGTLIGMARALGEAAPLLMIGMVAFIAAIPQDGFDPATVLPVQIYMWAGSPEPAFVERTSAAIMVLLALLVLINLVAVLLRRCFERRW